MRDMFIPTKQQLKGNWQLRRKYQHDKKMRMDAKYADGTKYEKPTTRKIEQNT